MPGSAATSGGRGRGSGDLGGRRRRSQSRRAPAAPTESLIAACRARLRLFRGTCALRSPHAANLGPGWRGAGPKRQQDARRECHARADAGLAAAAAPHHRPRRQIPWRTQGHQPLGRRADRRDQLRANPRPRAESGAAAGERRHQARRPRRDARLEHLAASGSLVRHPRHRRHLSHRQSAAVSRADRLDRQSRRRPHDVDRPHLRAALGKDRRQAADDRALHRAHRRRPHAEDLAEERGRLRGLDRRSRRRFRMARVRREHRRRHVLHLGHHRQSQGRALFAPLQCAARLHRGAAGLQGHLLARHRAAGGAAVPRQWLVARLLVPDGRRHAGAARRQDGRRLDLRTAQHLQGHLHRRGADGLADAAAGPGKDRQQPALLEARGDRRLGLPARHDARPSRRNTASRSSTPGA